MPLFGRRKDASEPEAGDDHLEHTEAWNRASGILDLEEGLLKQVDALLRTLGPS